MVSVSHRLIHPLAGVRSDCFFRFDCHGPSLKDAAQWPCQVTPPDSPHFDIRSTARLYSVPLPAYLAFVAPAPGLPV